MKIIIIFIIQFFLLSNLGMQEIFGLGISNDFERIVNSVTKHESIKKEDKKQLSKISKFTDEQFYIQKDFFKNINGCWDYLKEQNFIKEEEEGKGIFLESLKVIKKELEQNFSTKTFESLSLIFNNEIRRFQCMNLFARLSKIFDFECGSSIETRKKMDSSNITFNTVDRNQAIRAVISYVYVSKGLTNEQGLLLHEIKREDVISLIGKLVNAKIENVAFKIEDKTNTIILNWIKSELPNIKDEQELRILFNYIAKYDTEYLGNDIVLNKILMNQDEFFPEEEKEQFQFLNKYKKEVISKLNNKNKKDENDNQLIILGEDETFTKDNVLNEIKEGNFKLLNLLMKSLSRQGFEKIMLDDNFYESIFSQIQKLLESNEVKHIIEYLVNMYMHVEDEDITGAIYNIIIQKKEYLLSAIENCGRNIIKNVDFGDNKIKANAFKLLRSLKLNKQYTSKGSNGRSIQIFALNFVEMLGQAIELNEREIIDEFWNILIETKQIDLISRESSYLIKIILDKAVNGGALEIEILKYIIANSDIAIWYVIRSSGSIMNENRELGNDVVMENCLQVFQNIFKEKNLILNELETMKAFKRECLDDLLVMFVKAIEVGKVDVQNVFLKVLKKISEEIDLKNISTESMSSLIKIVKLFPDVKECLIGDALYKRKIYPLYKKTLMGISEVLLKNDVKEMKNYNIYLRAFFEKFGEQYPEYKKEFDNAIQIIDIKIKGLNVKRKEKNFFYFQQARYHMRFLIEKFQRREWAFPEKNILVNDVELAMNKIWNDEKYKIDGKIKELIDLKTEIYKLLLQEIFSKKKKKKNKEKIRFNLSQIIDSKKNDDDKKNLVKVMMLLKAVKEEGSLNVEIINDIKDSIAYIDIVKERIKRIYELDINEFLIKSEGTENGTKNIINLCEKKLIANNIINCIQKNKYTKNKKSKFNKIFNKIFNKNKDILNKIDEIDNNIRCLGDYA